MNEDLNTKQSGDGGIHDSVFNVGPVKTVFEIEIQSV